MALEDVARVAVSDERRRRARLGEVEEQAGVVRTAAALTSQLPVSTRRWLLRVVREGDVADLQDYRGMPAVTQFLGHPALDPAQTADLLAQWLHDEEAVTAVVEQDGHVVGDVRLRLRHRSAMRPARTTEVEAALGYAFHPRVHGQGLATECVGAVLDLALRAAGVRREDPARIQPGRDRPVRRSGPRRVRLVGRRAVEPASR